ASRPGNRLIFFFLTSRLFEGLFLDFGGEKALIADFCNRLVRGGCVDLVLDLLTGGIHGFVGINGHGWGSAACLGGLWEYSVCPVKQYQREGSNGWLSAETIQFGKQI